MANIPPSGCNVTAPPREYNLHVINIPSHVCTETIYIYFIRTNFQSLLHHYTDFSFSLYLRRYTICIHNIKSKVFHRSICFIDSLATTNVSKRICTDVLNPRLSRSRTHARHKYVHLRGPPTNIDLTTKLRRVQ